MKLKRKNKKRTEKDSALPARRSLPVDRYYSSRARRKGVDLREGRREPGRSSAPNSIAAPMVLVKVIRWAGAAGIVAVLLLNVGLRDVGVKIQPSNDPGFRDTDEYVATVQDVFDQSIFNKSKITLNSLRFEEELQRALPEVQQATAVVPLAGTRLQVGLDFAQPLARVQMTALRQGVVGQSGALLFESDSSDVLSRFPDLPLLRIEPSVSGGPGEQLLTSVETDLLSLLMLEFNGSDPHRHTLDSVTYNIEKREFQVDFNAVSYYAKLTSERDTRLQVGALLASLKDLAEKGQSPTQYIDVRVDGRVFVL